MAKQIRIGNAYHVTKVDDATRLLRLALENAKRADAPRLAIAIRRAIKSAGGARRHAQHRSARNG